MTVILIEEDNHGQIGVANNYYNAVKWLIGEHWLDDTTEVWVDCDEDDCHWRTLSEQFGEGWADMMTDQWDINDFNSYFDGSFYLTPVEVIGTEDDE